MTIADQVYQKLNEIGIPFERINHEPVHTIEDCAAVDAKLGCITAKNYFLTTKNKKNFYLCVVRPEARFRTADISKQVGSSRLSFGDDEKLFEIMQVHSGAVSPMCLLFEQAKDVKLIVDRALLDVEKIAFHPCDNSQTLAMSGSDFFDRFLPAVNREMLLVEVHDFAPKIEIKM